MLCCCFEIAPWPASVQSKNRHVVPSFFSQTSKGHNTCHEPNFDPAPSRDDQDGVAAAVRRCRASLRGLCDVFSLYFRSGSGGSSGVDFCVIFPPPQRKHAKEFRDRTSVCTFFMLCKMCTFIKIPESSVHVFSNQGEKSCILAVKTPAFNGNKILETDDGKTICKSSYLACPTKIQSKSGRRADFALN